MKSLHDYFEAARGRKPLMNRERVDTLLDTYDSERPTGPRTEDGSSIHTRGLRMKIIIMAVLAATAGTLPFLSREESKEPPGITQGVVSSEDAAEQRNAASSLLEASSLRRKPRPKAADTISKRQKADTAADRLMGISSVPATLQMSPSLVTRDEPVMLKSADSVRARVKLMNASSPYINNPSGQKVAGIGMVELAAEDLAKLGIRVVEQGIYSTWRDDEEETDQFAWIISPNGINMSPKPVGGVEIPNFKPLVITDDNGRDRAMITDRDEEGERITKLTEQLREGGDPEEIGRRMDEELRLIRERITREEMQVGRLVPVLVRAGRSHTSRDSLARHHRPDVIFWYRPTREFLELLPADTRSRIEREIELVERLQETGIAARENPELREAVASDIRIAVGESPYLGALRESGGALVESSVSPNPASGNTTLKYRLSLPRTVSLSLHDLKGRRLRDFDFQGLKSAGEWQAELDLSGLANGIYLAVITTQQGERAIQRVVVSGR